MLDKQKRRQGMRVPRVGSIYTPGVRKISNAARHYKKLTDPPTPQDETKQDINFRASIAYYLKKYNTLPAEIKKNLSPKDAIDMFREMEFVANGVVKRNCIGQGNESKVYDNPWLKEYHFLVLNNSNDTKLNSETIYTKLSHLGDAVWADTDDGRIQLVTS